METIQKELDRRPAVVGIVEFQRVSELVHLGHFVPEVLRVAEHPSAAQLLAIHAEESGFQIALRNIFWLFCPTNTHICRLFKEILSIQLY